MTTQLAPDPTTRDGSGMMELSDAGRVYGWIGDRTIGFRGFANEEEAMAAAWMAHRTLRRSLARRDGARPIPIDVEPLVLVRDGERDRIRASSGTVATLIRPGEDSPSGPDSFGFEVVASGPSDATHLRARALFLYRTLRRSGIRWSMWLDDDRATTTAVADEPSRRPRARTGETTASEAGERRDHVIGTALVFGALALLVWSLFSVRVATLVLGTVAAVLAAGALAGFVRLVVADVRTDVRRHRSPRDDTREAVQAPRAA